MLHLHHSNRIEALYSSFSEVVAAPIDDVFIPELVVIEEPGMARWLSYELANQQGIAANINFSLPASFVWRLLHGQLQKGSSDAGFTKSSFFWRCMALLPSLKDKEGFDAIHRYLSDADSEIKTYQLSRQIADLFDQYLIYRPEMIMQWEAGTDDHWQACLWREMRKISSEYHWAGLLEEFSQSLKTDGFKSGLLPERISLFAISALSPGYIELISRISEYIDIHLFILNPSINYWGDIVSEKDLAKLRVSWMKAGRTDTSDLYMVGNPLLASMGKPSRDFIDQLNDCTPQEYEKFIEPDGGALLSLIQGDILNLQSKGEGNMPTQLIAPDDSIQVHACHSCMREVQVLHDRLLSLFDDKSDLKPHEIVVVAPDINLYSPYIEAVFDAVTDNRHIPFSIADQSAIENPLIETLLSWLLLPDERFEAPTVLGWLGVPSVQACLDLDNDAIERIRQWVSESGIRWGLDGQHKVELGLPDNDENTWAFGFRRILLGYAMPSSVDLYQQIAPYSDIEGSEAVWFGQLCAFIECLAKWRKILIEPVGVKEWLDRINQMISQFFLVEESDEILVNNVRELLANMVESAASAGFDGSISARVMHDHLSSILSSAGTTYRLLSGRVTFCNMVPVRSLPFRVVCLLGMNDGDFPRCQRPLGFDLIAKHPRKGDRSLREDDRYLFLEALLSARDILHISYVGRSQKDNSERLPSVVVTELLDYVNQGYQLESGDMRSKVLIEHPLQPFSKRNYEIGSYAHEWQERNDTPEGFAEVALKLDDDNEEESISLDSLIRFVCNPSRHFLEHLGIRSAEYEEALEESECFSLDSLAAYFIKNEVLAGLLNNQPIGKSFDQIRARGELPHGEVAKNKFDEKIEGINEMSEKVKIYLDERDSLVEVALDINGTSLTGWLPDIIEGGVFRYRPAKIKGKDQLTLWVEHLANCASGNTGKSIYVAIDGEFKLRTMDSEKAIQHLELLLNLYKEGCQYPIPLFSLSSNEYSKIMNKKDDEEKALLAAKKKWASSQFSIGDDADPWYAQAFGGVDPFDEKFQQISQMVIKPMLDHAE